MLTIGRAARLLLFISALLAVLAWPGLLCRPSRRAVNGGEAGHRDGVDQPARRHALHDGNHHLPDGPAGSRPSGGQADGGLRRSEAAALTWGDVEFWPDGTGQITIRKGKNQPDPQTVAVTSATSRALQEIKELDPTSTTSVFGLTGEALANRVRAAARAAGLGDGFTGHSGRIGMARRMVAAGAPNAAVQNQGRWKHGDMVARYTRGEAAGEALKWLS